MNFFVGDFDIEDEQALQQEIERADAGQCIFRLPTGYLSVTQLHMYLRCPRQYYWRYVKDVRERPQAIMVDGSAVHKALELSLREKMEKATLPSADTMMDAYLTHWRENRADDMVFREGEDNEEAVHNLSRRLLCDYHKDHAPRVEPKMVEQRFDTVVSPLHIPMRGVIDLVDTQEGLPTVIDHKVTHATKSKDELERSLQLTLYAHHTGVPLVGFNQLVKTKTPKIVRATTMRTAEQVRWLERVVVEVARAIDKGVFPPCNPTSYTCSAKWCGYHNMCHNQEIIG